LVAELPCWLAFGRVETLGARREQQLLKLCTAVATDDASQCTLSRDAAAAAAATDVPP